MSKLLLSLSLIFSLLATNVGLANEHVKIEKSPQEFVQYFFDGFNAQNEKVLDKVFNKPFMRVSDGKTTYYSSWREYVDFKRIKATGWKKSVINNSSVHHQDKSSAILKMNFSRLDQKDEIVIQSDLIYLLTKGGNSWKIAAVIIPSSVPVSSTD